MSVGFKLYREVRDFAPADWTQTERLVAWIIADDARDDTRASWIPLPLLCQRAGLAPRTVRETLQSLAERGYEFRVIHGYGKDGRPVYAARGHSVDYRIPDMVAIGGGDPPPIPVDNPGDWRRGSATNGGIKAAVSRTKAAVSRRKGGGDPPPHTSVSSVTTSTKEPGVTYSNVEVRQLQARSETRIDANGHLPIELAALRAALSRREHQETA